MDVLNGHVRNFFWSPRGGDSGDDTAPMLTNILKALGEEYGPMGVALAAARLTDQNALVAELTWVRAGGRRAGRASGHVPQGDVPDGAQPPKGVF